MNRTVASVFLWFAAYGSSATAQTPALLLFGDADRKTFLGCLNCSRFDSGSVCNQFGDNGSQFSSYSIWNQFNDFGSRFSDYSPWNQFTSAGPVIVDKDGNFYGRLTANKFVSDRTRIKQVNQLTDLVAGGADLVTVAQVAGHQRVVCHS